MRELHGNVATFVHLMNQAAHKNVDGSVVMLDGFVNVLVSDGNLTLR